ncbi:protein FAM200C-like [Phyllobates terribilis]|uniref:protein FAM200C-like n=1 Tax=Phyllobates terribilis TaxID=111132 RepID=UPI003CCAF7D8
MSSKKRKWSDEYVQHGFTCITERDGSQRPICMICNAKLSNSSLAPAKQKEHFLKLHGDGEYKNTTLAEFKVKRARFDERATLPALRFVPVNNPILTALYEVAYLIAKQGKPHTIGLSHELATKTLPPKMAEVLKTVVEFVNYVRNSALRHRIFSELCKEIGSEFEVLLYHSNVRWLSRGQVLNRVFAMRVELALFLQEHQHCHADCFKNPEFILILAYMADIFSALNHLNQQMQGGGVNIMEAEENLKAFKKKLPLWKRRTENNNFANFLLLDNCVRKIKDMSGIGDISVSMELKQTIATHLDELAKSLDGYFPTRESYPAWMKLPFMFAVETADVNYEYLDEIIEIQQSQVQQQHFRTTTRSTFWCRQLEKYPIIAKKALEFFIPFVTTYLCEQSFSRMLDIKTKKRNRLCCENDMRLALAKVKPRISELVSQKQQQKSH